MDSKNVTTKCSHCGNLYNACVQANHKAKSNSDVRRLNERQDKFKAQGSSSSASKSGQASSSSSASKYGQSSSSSSSSKYDQSKKK